MPPSPPLAVLLDRVRAFRSSEAPEDVALAAVATILRAGSHSPEVLFIERARREGDPWSGDIAFPGGKREVSDASLQITAIRETHEEVGLILHPSSFVARLDDVFGRTNGYRVAQFVFVITDDTELVSSPEVASFFWIPLADVLDRARREQITIDRMGFSFEVPCVRLGEHVLWGMTYRMIHALAEAMQLAAIEPP